MLCDLDPNRLESKFFPDTLEIFAERTAPAKFSNLLTLAKSNLGKDSLRAILLNAERLEESEVELSTFATWAKSTGIDLPKEFPGSLAAKQPHLDEKPLAERERATLLTLIAALSHEAGIDITKPSKAAGLIEGLTLRIERRIAARTIEEHLKRIPAALEKRSP